MIEWKPIETAPKDGREILIWCNEYETLFVCYWYQHKTKNAKTNGWREYRLGYSPVNFSEGPIYWMPLPEPPK